MVLQRGRRWLVERAVSPAWRGRIGRAALFAYALHASIYLSFAAGFVRTADPAFHRVMTVVFVLPALVVLWGFWRAHMVIGWSVWGLWSGMMLFASSYASVFPSARMSGPLPPHPLFPVYALGLHLWYAPGTLALMIMFWAWDRQLPLPLSEKPQEATRPVPDPRGYTRGLLLGGLGAFMLWGGGSLLLLLYLEHAMDQSLGERLVATWPALGTLTATQNPQADLVAFHSLSLTMLAAMLWAGVWYRRSDIAEAGSWLLLPSQIITMGWMSGYPLLKAATLLLLFLFFLVHWYHGAPRILWQNRRGRWRWTTGGHSATQDMFTLRRTLNDDGPP